MAIGRTFQESLQKALRGLETGLTGLDEIEIEGLGRDDDKNPIRAALGTPTPNRLLQVAQAMRLGWSNEDIFHSCKIDPWFLSEMRGIVDMEEKVRKNGLPANAFAMRSLKTMGFSDARLAVLAETTEAEVTAKRHALGVRPVYKRIDTCAAEFASPTAYMYSTYEAPFAGAPADESAPSDKKKVIILGGGPNRIGQGIEFDYCCCHACFALHDAGYESIMVNCNPETVSTDYDTSDRLYFEPLTAEDVLEIVATERRNGTLHGVIVQFGGQTPLKLAEPLEEADVPILGTSPDAIDLAEDRDRSDALEVDVDCLADGKDTFIAGIMEHIEEAGIHSGDSACVLPPHSLSPATIAELERQTRALALALKVGGLMNVQYAIKDGDIYVLEVNPRASRTVPFVAKVVGIPIAKIAARIMAGESLASFSLEAPRFDHVGVKEAVFPFARFPGVDTVLGPEMKSTGEVMGLDHSFAVAFAKSQIGGGSRLPREGTVFVSVKDTDKPRIPEAVRLLASLGLKVSATA